MALPLSPGDVITLGTLLFKTYQKCKSASAEYQDLARGIQSIQYCVQSTQCSVNNIYHDLPEIHKVSLGTAIAGLRDVVTSISDDLDKVSTIRPDRDGPQLSKLVKFVILQNPRKAETKLTTRLTLLNVCVGAIIKRVIRSVPTCHRVTDL